MFANPLKNLRTLGLRENDIVADLGAGTGYYSIAAGRLVPQGKVYAVEIVKDFLHTIHNKVKDAHLSNVEILWGNIEKIGGTKIADAVVDAVIASNVLFQAEDKNKFVEETRRILKKGGAVLLVDWMPDSTGISPTGAIAKNKARELFETHGFVLGREIDAGAHHYGMILMRQ